MTTQESLPPPPQDREEILEIVGPRRARIYATVRQVLDDFERVARWEQLYYPPVEVEEFLRVQTGILELIEEIPYRISEMSVTVLAEAFADLLRTFPETVVDDMTRHMVAVLLDPSAARDATRSTRQLACEAVARFPDSALPEAQKALLRWMIDRHAPEPAPEPAPELSDETYEEAIRSFPEEVLDSSMRQILTDVPFYFEGIHAMTTGDVAKLRQRIELFRNAEAAGLTAQERVFTCEISADLKGKYTSAIMGAAANLVAEGHWNGAEVEPVLFPEKAEEFARNEQLVETLRQVLESIRRLSEEVPLIELVACWETRRRIDRYALTHLYGFLGNIGKLMKESSRRALYSGDYHQIQLREHRLGTRINELNMLHSKTWEVLDDTDPNIQDAYPQMVDKAVELAAIVDVELLKKMIGEDSVRLLLQIVSIEGGKRRELDVRLGHEQASSYRTPQSLALRQRLPERQHALVELLYDEDLYTFLELLLGSVLKRASFTVRQRHHPAGGESGAAGGPAADATPEAYVRFDDLSVLDGEARPAAAAAGTPAAGTPAAGTPAAGQRKDDRAKLAALETLRESLEEITSIANPHRKSFDLVHRLLTQKGMIPPAMVQSILPFLDSLTDRLVPELTAVSAQGDIPITYQSELMQYCRDLSRRDLTPLAMKTDVLNYIEGLQRLLGDIEAITLEMIDARGPARRAAAPEGEVLSGVDDFLSPSDS